MKKAFSWASGTLVLLLAMLIYYLTPLQPPQKRGEVVLPGLKSRVWVGKNQWGIPLIEAENEEDAYRALGYITAEERLFQMEVTRRIISGTMAEVFGPGPENKVVNIDIMARKLRVKKHMQDFIKNQMSQRRQKSRAYDMAESYLAGVNQYVQDGVLSPEFKVLGFHPAPFTLAEMMGVAGFMGLRFSEGIISDLLMDDLLDELPTHKLEELLINVSQDKNRITDKYYWPSPRVKSKLKKFSIQYDKINSSFLAWKDALPLLNIDGSNSWVLGPQFSTSGSALLANDPHIGYSNPSVFFEAMIKTPKFQLYGYYIPLFPFAIIGHNEHKGWTITMSMTDDVDLYRETIDMKEKRVQNGPDSWGDLKIEKESIDVKGEKSHSVEVIQTPRGPLMHQTEIIPVDEPVSLFWSFYREDNYILESAYDVGMSQNINQFQQAIAKATAPGVNLSYADRKGNIAWFVQGKIPRRRPGVDRRFVLEGNNPSHTHTDFLAAGEMPHVVNPERGYIITANYHPAYSSKDVEGYWQSKMRFERIDELLMTRDKWTLETFKHLQTDLKLHRHNVYVKSLIDSLSHQQRKHPLVTVLKDWDGFSSIESRGAAVYNVLLIHLLKEVLLDELGEERYLAYTRLATSVSFIHYLFHDPESDWWDDVRTKNKSEKMGDIVYRSLEKTQKMLETKLGTMENWSWGHIHQVEYVHPLGRVKPLNYIFNIGPYPAPGSYSHINNIGSRRFDFDFKVVYGPATRRLIDFASPEKSLSILPTGNSGWVGSKHYSDQAEMYLDGKYRSVSLKKSDYQEDEFSFIP